MQDNSYTHFVIIFLLVTIAANLFILDIAVFSPNSPIRTSQVATVATTPIPIQAGATCPDSCVSLIDEATTNVTPVKAGVELNTESFQQSSPREYYIPLGSGTTNKSEWENLTATETVIDPSLYGNIKEAYFIASLGNPTQNGQVEAQLINVTDKHPVWGSHVILNGPASQTITSSKITLDHGSKLYRVQMKSTLSYTASVDNAKIRIVAQ